jgi:tetratricopeptide (TPR) repeat protein
LLQRKKALIQKIESLSRLIETTHNKSNKRDEIAPGAFLGSLFIDRMKRDYAQRLILFIENDDYGRAIEVIEKMLQLPYQAEEKTTETILSKMLSILKEYSARIDYLNRNASLEDLKLSYLNEDYRNALWKLNLPENKEYLRPMLTGLRGALYSNIKQVEEIEKEVEIRQKMKELNKKAELFEQKGEYPGAIEIYEEFLTYHLSPYDREYLIKKLQSLRLAYEMERMRREQNSKALEYLSEANALAEKGNRKGAIDTYTLILKECPTSDYVEKAVSGIVSLASAREQTVKVVQTY